MNHATPPSARRRSAARFLTDTRGANMVEYIILVGVIALLALAGFSYFGGKVDSKITEQGRKVNQIQ